MYQMGKMHLVAALLFSVALVFPLQLECTTTCQVNLSPRYCDRADHIDCTVFLHCALILKFDKYNLHKNSHWTETV